jgi:hypothetical protein
MMFSIKNKIFVLGFLITSLFSNISHAGPFDFDIQNFGRLGVTRVIPAPEHQPINTGFITNMVGVTKVLRLSDAVNTNMYTPVLAAISNELTCADSEKCWQSVIRWMNERGDTLKELKFKRNGQPTILVDATNIGNDVFVAGFSADFGKQAFVAKAVWTTGQMDSNFAGTGSFQSAAEPVLWQTNTSGFTSSDLSQYGPKNSRLADDFESENTIFLNYAASGSSIKLTSLDSNVFIAHSLDGALVRVFKLSASGVVLARTAAHLLSTNQRPLLMTLNDLKTYKTNGVGKIILSGRGGDARVLSGCNISQLDASTLQADPQFGYAGITDTFRDGVGAGFCDSYQPGRGKVEVVPDVGIFNFVHPAYDRVGTKYRVYKFNLNGRADSTFGNGRGFIELPTMLNSINQTYPVNIRTNSVIYSQRAEIIYIAGDKFNLTANGTDFYTATMRTALLPNGRAWKMPSSTGYIYGFNVNTGQLTNVEQLPGMYTTNSVTTDASGKITVGGSCWPYVMDIRDPSGGGTSDPALSKLNPFSTEFSKTAKLAPLTPLARGATSLDGCVYRFTGAQPEVRPLVANLAGDANATPTATGRFSYEPINFTVQLNRASATTTYVEFSCTNGTATKVINIFRISSNNGSYLCTNADTSHGNSPTRIVFYPGEKSRSLQLLVRKDGDPGKPRPLSFKVLLVPSSDSPDLTIGAQGVATGWIF